jgi:hypothetical protein
MLLDVSLFSESKPKQTELPIDAPGISASRHDDHNVEIKIFRDIKRRDYFETFDLYLFIPKSFDIPFWGKAELQRDFRIRMRVSLPETAESQGQQLKEARSALEHSLRLYLKMQPVGISLDSLDTMVFDTCRDVGALFVEGIKQHAGQCTRHLKSLSALNKTEMQRSVILRDAIEDIQNTSLQVCNLREIEGYSIGLSRGSVALLDEFVSYAYVQYLATIRQSLVDGIHQDVLSESNRSKVGEIVALLDQAQSQEAEHRKNVGLPDDRRSTDHEREERLLRLSLIKKFFQAKSFVSVGRQPVMKKFSESTAIAGTLFAGLVAAVVQRLDHGLAASLTASGFIILTFSVFVYVLRDRLKDWARQKFDEKVAKILPDFQQDLEMHGNRIGKVEEWFSIKKKSELPSEVRALRKRAYTSKFEEALPEEALCYTRAQELTIGDASDDKNHRALHEIIRLNIERYLKYMDDPLKETMSIDNYGKLFRANSRRVYHFYLCIRSCVYARDEDLKSRWLKTKKKKVPLLKQDLVYRLVLNKSGLIRLENINF